MVDCDIEYAVASYKGIEFEVLPVDESGGRRIVVNQYPFTDAHYNEDLGATATTWSVRGAFVGDDFRDKLTTAKRVWARGGPGPFFEPTENKTHNATLVDYQLSYSDKKLNYVEFTLNLVDAGENPYPSSVRDRAALKNTSEIILEYLRKVRAIYLIAMNAVQDFNSVSTGIRASRSFVDDAARATLSASTFVATRAAIAAGTPSRVPGENVDRTDAIFEAAISGDPDIYFFKRSSEVRSAGNDVIVAQTSLTALTAYGYYFERLASGSVSFAELAEFRERGISLKTLEPEIAGAVDSLIVQLGNLAVEDCEQPSQAGAHALVASYELFGDVSRAYDIVVLSRGVSGAKMPTVITPCDTL